MMDVDLRKLFPPHLSDDFEIIRKLLPLSRHPPKLGDHVAFIGSEKIAVDCRIYNDWPADISSLTEIQNKMLWALYTKHHDGYMREKHLHGILDLDDEWIPPFVFSILGEYIVEIVQAIEIRKGPLAAKKSYRSFIRCNPEFINLVESRCASYWNCYYRHGKYKNKNEYPGLVCLNYMRAFARKAA